jgi:hypothetical protein
MVIFNAAAIICCVTGCQKSQTPSGKGTIAHQGIIYQKINILCDKTMLLDATYYIPTAQEAKRIIKSCPINKARYKNDCNKLVRDLQLKIEQKNKSSAEGVACYLIAYKYSQVFNHAILLIITSDKGLLFYDPQGNEWYQQSEVRNIYYIGD